jgi:hypothetical protein
MIINIWKFMKIILMKELIWMRNLKKWIFYIKCFYLIFFYGNMNELTKVLLINIDHLKRVFGDIFINCHYIWIEWNNEIDFYLW